MEKKTIIQTNHKKPSKDIKSRLHIAGNIVKSGKKYIVTGWLHFPMQ